MNNEEAIKLVANWLKDYNNDVVLRVMKNYKTIINDETTYTMLSKLYDEEMEEKEHFIMDITDIAENGIDDITSFSFRIWNKSTNYREVLYDLYIR